MTRGMFVLIELRQAMPFFVPLTSMVKGLLSYVIQYNLYDLHRPFPFLESSPPPVGKPLQQLTRTTERIIAVLPIY